MAAWTWAAMAVATVGRKIFGSCLTIHFTVGPIVNCMHYNEIVKRGRAIYICMQAQDRLAFCTQHDRGKNGSFEFVNLMPMRKYTSLNTVNGKLLQPEISHEKETAIWHDNSILQSETCPQYHVISGAGV